MRWMIAFTAALAAILADVGSAQCVTWNPGFHLSGADNEVFATASFGGSPGAPDLYIGGAFKRASDVDARCLAKWDGSNWTQPIAVGVGDPNPFVAAMAVWNDGTGPALYVGGSFTNVGGIPASNIARWNGTQWTALGSGVSGPVRAMATFDDGSGPALYIGGAFLTAGGNPAARIARWNGSAWSMPAVNGSNGEVLALEVHDDGTGAALYAGGDFTFLDGTTKRLSKWNGASWTALPGTMNGAVLGLESWNDGTGPGLYACGSFTQSQGTTWGLARWSGASWSSVGGSLWTSSGFPRGEAVQVFDDGSGPALYVVGRFERAGTVNAIGAAKWNGVSWAPMGAGLSIAAGNLGGGLHLDTWNTPAGSKLVVTGSFTKADNTAVEGLASWRGTWSSISPGSGLPAPVRSLVVHDDGTGPALYVGGEFSSAGGGVGVSYVGRWNGSGLVSLGLGADDSVYSMASFQDGTGPRLFAAGIFSTMGGVAAPRCAMWNGTAWSNAAVGLPTNTTPQFAVYDSGSGPQLYNTNGWQRWNGSSWASIPGSAPITMRCTVTMTDVSGPKLYVSGTHLVGANVERRVAAFDGTAWTLLPGLFTDEPSWMCVFDDGTGPALHVFGSFTDIGGVPITGAAKWDGLNWNALGSGIQGPPIDLRASAVLPATPSSSAKLYLGGAFVLAGGTTVSNLAMWDGVAWHDVQSGVDARVDALCTVDSPSGPELWVGGLFKKAGGKVAYRLTRFSNTCQGPIPYCFGDGSGTACPCGNAGIAGNGCANSIQANGAHLAGTGVTSVSNDTLLLTATNVPNGPGLYYQGTAQPGAGLGTVFGDGLRCAGGSVIRLGIVIASGGASTYPSGVTPPNGIPITIKGLVASGTTLNYQLWYRDSSPTFCSASVFNLTNALQVLWSP